MGGSASGGGNGGGANVPGTPIVPSAPKKKKKNIIQSLIEASPTVRIIKAVGQKIDDSRKGIKRTKGGDVYAKEVLGYDEASEKSDYVNRNPLGNQDDRDGGGQNYDPVTRTAKSIEQPKTKSQMDNTDVKSDLITAKGPTSPEMDDEEIALKRKRRGRKSTILTDKTEEEKATLSKKTLLG